MGEDSKTMEDRVLDALSNDRPETDDKSAEDNAAIQHPRQNAGQDESMLKRLEKDPECVEARLDVALDESMDASDPPSSTQPVHNMTPATSSGYDAEAEARLKAG